MEQTIELYVYQMKGDKRVLGFNSVLGTTYTTGYLADTLDGAVDKIHQEIIESGARKDQPILIRDVVRSFGTPMYEKDLFLTEMEYILKNLRTTNPEYNFISSEDLSSRNKE